VPTNRTPISRPWRPGLFSREVIELFLKCERVPVRKRWDSEEWKANSKRLACLLDLGQQWFCSKHVNDAGRPPEDIPGTFDYHDWKLCRDVRERLLEAIKPLSGRRPRIDPQPPPSRDRPTQ
jgi:hypothetical protein